MNVKKIPIKLLLPLLCSILISGSTLEWIRTNPANEFGGELKSLCVLWGVGCKPSKPRFTNPCDEYTLTEDYIDCIEDNARPDPNYDPY